MTWAKHELGRWAPVPRLLATLRGAGLMTADNGPVIVARAPGRLDVMGGIADYSGSLVCEMPLAVAAAAAVQKRSDGRVVCRSAQAEAAVTLPLAALATGDPRELGRMLEGPDTWARYVVGCAWWLFQQAQAQSTGLSIVVDSDVPLGGGVSSSAAIEVAVMSALADLLRVTMTPLPIAMACQQVENHVVGAPCGVMDQVTAALGAQGSMLELLCQDDPVTGASAQVLGQVQVPPGYALLGIHSGVRHEVSGDPYTDTRVAAFMAQKILSSPPINLDDRGHLANVNREPFLETLQQKLPVTLRGAQFLAEFGGTNDTVTRVNPDKDYAVRPAAMHHVLEMWRVRRFVRLVKGGGDPDQTLDSRMVEAGQLMDESHDSYSQCAMLGHAMTDKLVAMIKACGVAKGFYGAKITGGGGGGTVAVLTRDEPAVRAAVEDIRRRYTQETGRPTLLFADSSPGSAVLGTMSVSFEQLP